MIREDLIELAGSQLIELSGKWDEIIKLHNEDEDAAEKALAAYLPSIIEELTPVELLALGLTLAYTGAHRGRGDHVLLMQNLCVAADE